MEIENSLDFTTINYDYIKYTKPCRKSGVVYSFVKYIDDVDNRKNLIIYTPLLKCMSDIMESDNRRFAYFFLNKNKDTRLFEFLSDIDEKNLLTIYNNCSEWFKQKIPLDILEEYNQPFIKIKKDKMYIKVYINNNDDSMNNIKKGDLVSIKMFLKAIKFKNQLFRSEWELIEVINKENYNENYKFYDELLDLDKDYLEYLSDSNDNVEPDSMNYVGNNLLKNKIVKNKKKMLDKTIDNNSGGTKNHDMKKNLNNNDSVENGPVENDSVENNSIENNSVENDSVENDSVEKDSVENDSVENNSVENNSVENENKNVGNLKEDSKNVNNTNDLVNDIIINDLKKKYKKSDKVRKKNRKIKKKRIITKTKTIYA